MADGSGTPLVNEARLEATRLAYSELRSVSNLGRWKEGGEKGLLNYIGNSALLAGGAARVVSTSIVSPLELVR